MQALAADDLAAAEPPLRQVVEARPELATPRLNLGLLYARTGRDEAALAALREAARLDPGLAAAHTQMGILLRQAGDFQGARAAYERALAADPDHARAHLNLGILFDLYLQQPARALRHYERYQALDGGGDREVKMWIVDLRQRLKSLARNDQGGTAP
ncbi:MAG TPA: tetratricopeptide repeat protein [Gammaproteobacteria bacterium]|nr:tetratricopeptide repeat protein [Gammaproteobacteria bacterium]